MSEHFFDDEKTERINAAGVVSLDRGTITAIGYSIINPVAEKALDAIRDERATFARESQAVLREVREGLERMEGIYGRCVNLKFQMLGILGKNRMEGYK